MIPRVYDDLNKYLKKGKVLVIYGPRQVGKTTLLKNFLSKTALKYRYDTGEDFRISQIFSSDNPDTISEYAAGYELVVIDEAQKIKNIGTGLKILIDNNPNLRLSQPDHPHLTSPETLENLSQEEKELSQCSLSHKWNYQ